MGGITFKTHGIMTNEEYRNLKLQAHQQLVEDYHWLMSQSPAQYTWRCPQRWLIELVYNANQDRPVDEWQRDIPLTRLYRDFFTHIGTKPPNHPSTQLSKLRNMERRRDIQPALLHAVHRQAAQLPHHREAPSSEIGIMLGTSFMPPANKPLLPIKSIPLSSQTSLFWSWFKPEINVT